MTSRRTNGEAVRSLRITLGIPQTDLARRVGISAGFLSNIEAGRKQPSPSTTRRIADHLGVPLDAITYPITAPGDAA